MFTIELFPAKYGDAILVTYGDAAAPSRILIDAGVPSSASLIAARLAALDAHVDLFVVTHIDLDHVGGAVALLRNPGAVKRIGGVWFNGFKHLDEFSDLLGPIQGEQLTKLLIDLRIPWNIGWPWRHDPNAATDQIGGPVVAKDGPLTAPLPGGAQAILLSPTPVKLAKLLPVWSKVVKAAGLVIDNAADPDPAEAPKRMLLGDPTLQELAAAKTPDDDAEANGSSIAFILEAPDGAETRRILFGADAHPDALITSLSLLLERDAAASPEAADRGAAMPPGAVAEAAPAVQTELTSFRRVRLDACKLPHHGSRRNLSRQLVRLLDCPRWLVSTNGDRFSHPNPEALARVVLDGSGPPVIYTNYGNPFVAEFATAYPPATHGYALVQPPDGAEGIIVDLAAPLP